MTVVPDFRSMSDDDQAATVEAIARYLIAIAEIDADPLERVQFLTAMRALGWQR